MKLENPISEHIDLREKYDAEINNIVYHTNKFLYKLLELSMARLMNINAFPLFTITSMDVM